MFFVLKNYRPVALTAEHRTPNPMVGGSNPSWPAISWIYIYYKGKGKMLKKIKEFFKEVKIEMKKVVFPSREEVIGSTKVVLVLVLIIAVFLGVIDQLLSKFVNILVH